MEIWHRFARVLKSLAGRGPVDVDLADEVSSYLELLIDEKVASGMPPDEARRQARIEMGGAEQVKEQVRAGRPGVWLDTLARDVRHGLRLLAHTPAFSASAIAVLALGIAANVAVFGLVNVLLFQPRVGSGRPGQLVGIYSHDPRTPDSYRRFSFEDYEAIRDNASAFSDVAAHRNTQVVFTDGETTRRAAVTEVGGSYFSALGVRLALGRAFTPDEDRPGSGAAVAVVTHETWQALGGSPSVIGRTVFLNAHPFTVVGVAPAGFSGTMVAFGPLLWIPLGADTTLFEAPAPAAPATPATRDLLLAARLKPGISIDAATSALVAVSRHLEQIAPRDNTGRVLTVHRLARTEQGDDPRTDAGLYVPLATLSGMALVLLAVASLNVANMQLARGTSRRKEIAMRLALGAGPARVAWQLLAEGLILSLAGGAVGLVLGTWILKLVAVSFTPAIDETLAFPVTPDIRVVLATAGFALASAAVFALGPSLRLSRLDLLGSLKGSTADGPGSGTARLGPRHLVVAGQVALSLALLVAAGLFVRAAVESGRTDPGYRLSGQLVMRVEAAGCSEASGREAFRDLMRHVRATPGVASATVASLVAFANDSAAVRVQKAGAAPEPAADQSGAGVAAQNYAVGEGYFRTLGVPLLRGRDFTAAEEQEPSTARVVVIDEPLANALFPGQDPMGLHLQVGASRPGRLANTFEIVGVVPGLRHRLTRGLVPHIYRPFGSHYGPRLNIHIRAADDRPTATTKLVADLRAAARAADPRLAVLGVSTMEEVRDSSPVSWLVRTAGQAFGALGVIALAMAVTGLYGVKAYLVARRTREFGIRMALGATPAVIVRTVLEEGSVVVGCGVLLGILMAIGTGHVVSGMLVGVRPLDPAVFILASATLIAAVLAASYFPARRATRSDPSVALRTE